MWVLGAEFRAFGKAASTLNSWTSVAMLTHRNDGTEFGGSIYQKVNKKLETAVNLAWTAGNSDTHFGIAAKYQVNPDTYFSAKVNNSSLIGLGYTQTLKPGIKLTLSALLDARTSMLADTSLA